MGTAESRPLAAPRRGRGVRARCHGDRDENVRLVKLPPRRVRYESVLSSGKAIRRDFETRLDTREPESAL